MHIGVRAGRHESEAVADIRLTLAQKRRHDRDDGYLNVTANQLHRQARYHNGQDQREQPYALIRIAIEAEPVLLR